METIIVTIKVVVGVTVVAFGIWGIWKATTLFEPIKEWVVGAGKWVGGAADDTYEYVADEVAPTLRKVVTHMKGVIVEDIPEKLKETGDKINVYVVDKVAPTLHNVVTHMKGVIVEDIPDTLKKTADKINDFVVDDVAPEFSNAFRWAKSLF